MEKVEFTQIENDSLKSQVIGSQDENNIIKPEEKGSVPTQESLHVYIAFEDGISIDDGIKTIETQVCKDTSLQVLRRDENGNAIVAIVSAQDTKTIEKLEVVSFLKVDKGANLTNQTAEDDTKSEAGRQETITQEKAQQDTSKKEETTEAEKSTKENTEDSNNEAEQNIENNEVTNSQSTTEIRDDIDTITRTNITPIAIAVILGLCILFGFILNKFKR